MIRVADDNPTVDDHPTVPTPSPVPAHLTLANNCTTTSLPLPSTTAGLPSAPSSPTRAAHPPSASSIPACAALPHWRHQCPVGATFPICAGHLPPVPLRPGATRLPCLRCPSLAGAVRPRRPCAPPAPPPPSAPRPLVNAAAANQARPWLAVAPSAAADALSPTCLYPLPCPPFSARHSARASTALVNCALSLSLSLSLSLRRAHGGCRSSKNRAGRPRRREIPKVWEGGVYTNVGQPCTHADNQHNIVRMLDYLKFQNHLCIAFEMLGQNLYELLKRNHLRGPKMKYIRAFSKQILDPMILMRDAGIIHCDLKPENILVPSVTTAAAVKVIDFGSKCMEGKTVYSYIQVHILELGCYYMYPEVLLGYPYTTAIHLWPFGCIVSELFIGMPLFPVASEYDVFQRMIKILGGQPPDDLIREAKNSGRFFKHVGSIYSGKEAHDGFGSAHRMLTEEEVEAVMFFLC